MPRVRIELPDGDPARAMAGHGARIFVDDHELTDVRSVDVHIDHRSVVTANVLMFIHRPGPIIEGDIRLTVTAVVPPGYMLREEWETPTRREYTCVKIAGA